MKHKSPSEYVNPYIGTIGHLLTATRPTVLLPHGAARIIPNVLPKQHDYYFSDKIESFPVGQFSLYFSNASNDTPENAISHFDVSTVSSHPYLFRVFLEDSGITVSASTTKNCYAYMVENAENIFIRTDGNAECKLINNHIYLYTKKSREYFVDITVSCSFNIDIKENGADLNGIADICELFASVSCISDQKATEIMEHEINGLSFQDIVSASKQTWDDLLGRISVKGSEDMKTVYYTALYRSFGKMIDFSEYGQYYSGYDKSVHAGDSFYTVDQLWDSFRSMHPLQLLIEPENHKKMLDSYVEMYRQSGAMPSFPGLEGDSPVMFGFHAASLFADGIAKGIDTDYATAYEGIYRNATKITMLPWVADNPANELDRCYYEKGYFPALDPGMKEYIEDVHDFENRQCVAVTLEHAYDDWCTAQIARYLGKNEDYEMFMRRSKNYVNVYNKETGFMSPKNINGEWLNNFDPMLGGGQGGREYFAECNSYTFNFSVWHDIEGLAELMGGKSALCDRLDELFTTPCRPNKYTFLRQFPDSTGLMGMFCMGNEPSFHIPFFYNYCGKPWMTQRRLRMIIDTWFTNSPLGICGDEDSGAMSSWLAFSAIGIYPVCPGKSEYALVSPVFDEVEIKVKDNIFRIIADGASDGKKYIKSAKLNGIQYDKAFIKHCDIVSGGELVLELSDLPNRNWGLSQ